MKGDEAATGLSGNAGAAASADTRSQAPRARFDLDDRGFDEVPRKYRKFYRRWKGPDDPLAPNEALCPVCKIVIRSPRELRVGDHVYCMACMTRLVVVRGKGGRFEVKTIY